MDRKTKVIKTPVGGHEVVLYEWLTGGEKMGLASADPSMTQEFAIKTIVVSVDGNKEGVLSAIKEMHGKDFDFVFKEMTNTINDSSWEEKKSE